MINKQEAYRKRKVKKKKHDKGGKIYSKEDKGKQKKGRTWAR